MKRIVLEVSLKAFCDASNEGIQQVCANIIRQWKPLIDSVENIAFLIWAADGSEILDYRGQLEDEFEWAKWIGIANEPVGGWKADTTCLHAQRWAFCENAPAMTYERLGYIVKALKAATCRFAGKPASIGATFDPGPEFSQSSFKYERHPEISVGDTMGKNQWVHCAAVLHGDNHCYAGFPQGIPEGTTLGTFLGRQSQNFLSDLGFDYLWLSNGFGYSLSSWNVTGEVFDGQQFDTTGAVEVRNRILQFWHDFRRECPHFPLETRGSNLSTGMDLSSDASPLRDIYNGDFNLVAPPNSPWAAMTGDYGLELVGWLSHIAELPAGNALPYRFYIHDPWWLNSPWLDRYGREPHDIYLPLSVGRINEQGEVQTPDSLAFLTIDDSYGRMPDEVPVEVTPHLLRALNARPDAPGLITWIYPFDEYHEWTFGNPNRVNEVFFGDWFMRSAVNQGFPLNTVISTSNFLVASRDKGELFKESILLSPVPDAGSALADTLLEHLDKGGQVLLYGPIRHGDSRLLQRLNLKVADEISGTLQFQTSLTPDTVSSGEFPSQVQINPLLCGGGMETVALNPYRENYQEIAVVKAKGESRVFASISHSESGGRLGWVRGAFSDSVGKAMLPIACDMQEWFVSERIMRWMLAELGCWLRFEKPTLETPDPLILASRCRNAWYFSGYTPSTNTRLQWRLPQGVPVPVGCDVMVSGGQGTLSLPRVWHRECRVFIEQSTSGEVSCREQHSGEVGISRRLLLRGLKDATVRFLPDSSMLPKKVRFQKNEGYLGQAEAIVYEAENSTCLVAHHVSDDLLISW